MKIALLKSELAVVTALAASTAVRAQAVQTYASYVKQGFLEMLASLRNLSFPVKMAALALLSFIAIMLYLRTRDTAANNMRRARSLHRKAGEMHEKGRNEDAAQYYQKASEYREKAELQ